MAVSARRRIVRVAQQSRSRGRDDLAVEEPLEVRVDGTVASVTMRTPGHDFELALGFCLTEGIVADPREVAGIAYCDGSAPGPYQGDFNVVNLSTRAGRGVPEGRARRVYTASSCGVCGSASIDVVRRRVGAVHADRVALDPATLAALPEQARLAQDGFDRTGGLHAAAVFSADGTLACLREDVGRHNAVDKVIGWAATQGRLPLTGQVLFVSGRVAFEIVQKALVAGVPAVVAVSAPTTLAVDLAEESGLTLCGFVRGGQMNVYSGAERLIG